MVHLCTVPLHFLQSSSESCCCTQFRYRSSGQDYLLLIFVCLMILTTTGALHGFLLYTNNNRVQMGFLKADIYLSQLAVSMQVTVVIQRMDIEWQVLGPERQMIS